jgi:hypothetical protein
MYLYLPAMWTVAVRCVPKLLSSRKFPFSGMPTRRGDSGMTG